MFKAMLIQNNDDGYTTTLSEASESGLPEGDVTVDVAWSTLN